MLKGKIIKALSGFYYVESDSGLYQCRGRGNFRKKNISPLVGDHVSFEAENRTDGYIMAVDNRKNELNRPPIANIDQAILIFAAREPNLDTKLIDRFLVHVESKNIQPVLCITKTDLINAEELEKLNETLQAYVAIGYNVLMTSSRDRSGTQHLMESLTGKISVFAGQSGVGKSSLLNVLLPGLDLPTDVISLSLGRGKHTTRHVELIPVNNGWVADTPGFSSLDFQGMEPGALSPCFPEMAEASENCKFRGCTHLKEPGCAVKQAVKDGGITTFRYKHYELFYDEIKSQKRRYD